MADPPQSHKNADGMPIGRYIVAGLIGLWVILFAFKNAHRVEVDWVFFTRDSRLIYVIIVSALLGALADRLIQRRRHRGDSAR